MPIQRRVVQRVLGVLLTCFSLAMVTPVFVSLGYGDGALWPFVGGFATTALTGLALFLPVRSLPPDETLQLRDGFVVVVLFWIVLGTFGALPLWWYTPLDLSLAQAVFESMSGLTTTGATVIVGLDSLPHAVLFYRQQMQWLGGMGIIVLAVAILPMLGIGGTQLYRAETPGLAKEKLTPRMASTAKALWYIYLGLTLACGFSYWWAGMEPFDAIGHSFSTVAIGGFSTHDASIGYYDSSTIELIAVAFMLFSAINYGLHFLVARKMSAHLRSGFEDDRDDAAGARFRKRQEHRIVPEDLADIRASLRRGLTAAWDAVTTRERYVRRFRKYRYYAYRLGLVGVDKFAAFFSHYPRDEELRAFLILIGALTALTSVYLLYTNTAPFEDAVIDGLFHVVSIGTTTGFTSAEYFNWPGFLPVLLLFASMAGGCAGSTAGGMKVIRVLLLFKQGRRELRRMLHPHAMIHVKVGGERMPDRLIDVVWGFLASYVALLGIGLLLLMATGLDQETAFSAVVACLNNLGPGLGDVAANYSTVNDFSLVVLSTAMVFGRLEIFTLLVLFTPAFWQK